MFNGVAGTVLDLSVQAAFWAFNIGVLFAVLFSLVVSREVICLLIFSSYSMLLIDAAFVWDKSLGISEIYSIEVCLFREIDLCDIGV